MATEKPQTKSIRNAANHYTNPLHMGQLSQEEGSKSTTLASDPNVGNPTAYPRLQSQTLAEAWYNYNIASNAGRLPQTIPRSMHGIQVTQYSDLLLHPTAIMDKSAKTTTDRKTT
ncbi:Hypothetical predicted protein [Pelobates cultripes]|uniref:Uncharacterized protein n=1 Tax=Pelobates cultripes TaxID=61616 RepID=A0AAD1SS79_PELCU|nr:Hypothetical predicted protein [Pelobates cultripes]